MKDYRLCIIKPNKSAYSETFIQAHIDRLSGQKKVLYGGAFPVYDHRDSFLIKSPVGMLSYLFQKRILKRDHIAVRDRALSHYLRQEGIQVVLAEYGFTGAMVAPACKAAGVPLVIHFHGADAHHRQTVARYRHLYPDAFDYASAIIAVSQDMADALHALGAGSSKLILNPYGVDLERFQQVPISVKRNFLSVGRFVDKKAPDLVVRAFKKVHEVYPDARLWMVGNGALFENTRQLINELSLTEAINLTGVLDQAGIYELMSQTRCFVQHSVTAADGDMEGTPNTILEAAAVGLPIVSTRHAGIKQAVLDGKTGYLVDEYDVDGMAECMLKIAGASSEDLQAMGNAGRAHIEKDYAIRQQIAKLDQVIQNSLKR